MTLTTREKILSTAERLIQETGNAEVTLAQIATALGMTHAALYKHFQNKQALWEAVSAAWFQREIIDQIQCDPTATPQSQLHDWLWAFVTAKKHAYNTNPQMFALNTRYIDNNPKVLRDVLIPAYTIVSHIMGYHDSNNEQAESILATFAIFTLPNFKETWNDPDYAQRFERIWNLIKAGV
ncbi:TetR/AcrR family transcriptional regulator [Levilactobacillus fuyuanensis]|uniref:TetR family transcriptional regulator n=1 Tax=Levilactobacillus fuyuanensis TaxID=2486022 RepID=A0ABW4H5A5_9LACO|nr:TetR/AcrR family transcriptional regulator [Levilactobacillus fuyuanensis]